MGQVSQIHVQMENIPEFPGKNVGDPGIPWSGIEDPEAPWADDESLSA